MRLRAPKTISDPYTSREYMSDILQRNSQTPFVDRVLNRSEYPVLKQGNYDVTHKMAWAQVGDTYIVFPTVVMRDGQLIDLEQAGIDPVRYALDNQNFIKAKSPAEADWFSKNYKKYWNE